LSQKEKTDKINNFIDQIVNQWCQDELAYFIQEQKEGFFQNLTVSDYTTNNGKVIKQGTKLVKAFRYFMEKNDRRLFDI
jgi:hypothetical protein